MSRRLLSVFAAALATGVAVKTVLSGIDNVADVVWPLIAAIAITIGSAIGSQLRNSPPA